MLPRIKRQDAVGLAEIHPAEHDGFAAIESLWKFGKRRWSSCRLVSRISWLGHRVIDGRSCPLYGELQHPRPRWYGCLMGVEVSFIAAFLAGVLSISSPCVLPLVPIFLAHLAGASAGGVEGSVAVASCRTLSPTSSASGRLSHLAWPWEPRVRSLRRPRWSPATATG